MDCMDQYGGIMEVGQATIMNKREITDVEALGYIIPKEAKETIFNSKAKAEAFMICEVGRVPERLGIDMPGNIPGHLVASFLKGFGVNVVTKTMYPNQEFWRNGFYIYKDGDLKFFISIPLQRVGRVTQGGKIVIQEPVWVVRSNV